MPNIILNNYCNISCSYCFAGSNFKNKALQKNLNLKTYLIILKYLKLNNEEVRLLGGEPFLHPKINDFLLIAKKGGFDIIIFSNIANPIDFLSEKLKGITNIRINCNINNLDFYKKTEIENIEKNLYFLQQNNFQVILGYNIYDTNKNADFLFKLAEKYNIKAINLKITNSSLGEKLIIDNKKRELGIYIFNFIKKYHNDFFIEISCGLDKSIFLKEELDYINKNTSIKLKFGCEGNIGKFDINTDGTIFKCYPLETIYRENKLHISDLIKNKENLNKLFNNTVIKSLNNKGECIANKIIKKEQK